MNDFSIWIYVIGKKMYYLKKKYGHLSFEHRKKGNQNVKTEKPKRTKKIEPRNK